MTIVQVTSSTSESTTRRGGRPDQAAGDQRARVVARDPRPCDADSTADQRAAEAAREGLLGRGRRGDAGLQHVGLEHEARVLRTLHDPIAALGDPALDRRGDVELGPVRGVAHLDQDRAIVG